MHTLSQNFDLENTRSHTAQTGRQPELVVIARAAVQTNHQTNVTQPRFQDIDIGE